MTAFPVKKKKLGCFLVLLDGVIPLLESTSKESEEAQQMSCKLEEAVT